MQRSIILFDNAQIERLHEIAEAEGVTASWILRALYFKHRDLAIRLQPLRPKTMPSHSSPFTLCWHGDRQAIRNFLGAQGLEISAVLRLLLEMYLRGEIQVDLRDVRLVKWEHSPKTIRTKIVNKGTRSMVMHLNSSELFQNRDFWPINHPALIAIAAFGRAQSRLLRKFGPKK